MHYRNGREAKENDQVISHDSYTKRLQIGVVTNLNGNAKTCNAMLHYIKPGGVNQTTVTLSDCIYVEDAWDATLTLAADPPPITAAALGETDAQAKAFADEQLAELDKQAAAVRGK